jgi:hypothetical protein
VADDNLTIQPATIATLDDLESVEWFRNVGRAKPERARSVRTWAEAEPYLTSVVSENVRIAASNQLRERLLEVSEDQLEQWNARVDLVSPLVNALVSEKADDYSRKNAWPVRALDIVRWDILGIALEAEFSQWVKPFFYAELGFWYREGHFPIGWDGTLTDGRLVVF